MALGKDQGFGRTYCAAPARGRVKVARRGKCFLLFLVCRRCRLVLFPAGQVRFVFSRPFFLRGGDYMELKAAAAWYLKRELGAAFDRADFDDAWESGCAVEVATKARKAELTGVDKKHITTTTKTITLKAEVRVMWNNARSALVTKIMMVFREENGIPPRPKGQQNQSGKKVFKIEDGPWDVTAKKMQSARK